MGNKIFDLHGNAKPTADNRRHLWKVLLIQEFVSDDRGNLQKGEMPFEFILATREKDALNVAKLALDRGHRAEEGAPRNVKCTGRRVGGVTYVGPVEVCD